MTSYDWLWRTTWGDMQRYGPVHRHTLRGLVRTVASLDVASVLDVGCGSGENLAALARLARYDLAGVDVSAAAIGLARKAVPAARLSVLNVERDALEQRFDLVMSVQVVEHILDDMAAFRNIARMARKYVYVSTIQGRMRPSEIAIGHVRNYSSLELRRKLEAVGLRVVRLTCWGFPFYSPLYRSLVEWLPGGPPGGPVGTLGRLAATALYHLYRCNVPGHGDIVTALAAAGPDMA